MNGIQKNSLKIVKYVRGKYYTEAQYHFTDEIIHL